ncbi:hypothetical protein HN415_00895 [Candidatus Woesearchaeota archaeon]|jgi:hypothetical protein|nr:hypothetical protein [Candidatus Woesearchaeota archaeon]
MVNLGKNFICGQQQNVKKISIKSQSLKYINKCIKTSKKFIDDNRPILTSGQFAFFITIKSISIILFALSIYFYFKVLELN